MPTQCISSKAAQCSKGGQGVSTCEAGTAVAVTVIMPSSAQCGEHVVQDRKGQGIVPPLAGLFATKELPGSDPFRGAAPWSG